MKFEIPSQIPLLNLPNLSKIQKKTSSLSSNIKNIDFQIDKISKRSSMHKTGDGSTFNSKRSSLHQYINKMGLCCNSKRSSLHQYIDKINYRENSKSNSNYKMNNNSMNSGNNSGIRIERNSDFTSPKQFRIQSELNLDNCRGNQQNRSLENSLNNLKNSECNFCFVDKTGAKNLSFDNQILTLNKQFTSRKNISNPNVVQNKKMNQLDILTSPPLPKQFSDCLAIQNQIPLPITSAFLSTKFQNEKIQKSSTQKDNSSTFSFYENNRNAKLKNSEIANTNIRNQKFHDSKNKRVRPEENKGFYNQTKSGKMQYMEDQKVIKVIPKKYRKRCKHVSTIKSQ